MAQETVIIVAAVVCAGLVLVMVRLTRHFAGPQVISVTAAWIDELSVETTDLLHLLSEKDGQSLRTHLPRLRDDFRLICMAIKFLIVQSSHDRPDLARVLVRSQITFAYRMMVVRFDLAWDRWRLFSSSRPRPRLYRWPLISRHHPHETKERRKIEKPHRH